MDEFEKSGVAGMILCPMMASPSSWDIMGDTDDLFYDAARNRVYVPGARTGLFVPDGGKLFVAVPHRGDQRAEVLVHETN